MNAFAQSPNLLKTLFTFQDVSPKTQEHLTKVYSSLMFCTLVCAFGMYVNAAIIIQGFLLNFVSIVLSIFFIYQAMNRMNSESTRRNFLYALAFQLGFLVGPAMHILVEVEPKLVL